MNFVGIFLIFLLAANTCQADLVQLKGAAKRKRFVEPPKIDIEDVIRAEEDPNYSQYVKERELQKKADIAAALQQKKQRQAEAAAYERARAQFVKEEKKKVVLDESKEEELTLRERKAWEAQREKYRKEYVISEQRREDKLNYERMARLQKAFSPARMPASK